MLTYFWVLISACRLRESIHLLGLPCVPSPCLSSGLPTATQTTDAITALILHSLMLRDVVKTRLSDNGSTEPLTATINLGY